MSKINIKLNKKTNYNTQFSNYQFSSGNSS